MHTPVVGALGVSGRPVLVAVNVAAAAALRTPVTMTVIGPGGCRFGDCWMLGLPVTGWFFVVSVVIVPMIGRF